MCTCISHIHMVVMLTGVLVVLTVYIFVVVASATVKRSVMQYIWLLHSTSLIHKVCMRRCVARVCVNCSVLHNHMLEMLHMCCGAHGVGGTGDAAGACTAILPGDLVLFCTMGISQLECQLQMRTSVGMLSPGWQGTRWGVRNVSASCNCSAFGLRVFYQILLKSMTAIARSCPYA
jgi:hypothetical protein